MTTRLAVLLARLAGTVTGARRDARLAEEIDAHLDALAAAHEARGLSPHDARLAARREFGGVDQMTERHRDQRGFSWVNGFAHDIRHAVRRLRAEPWFSAAVIVALAIGIGGSVSVVGAVTAIAWSQPPFHEPDGVLSVGTVDEQGRRADLSLRDYQEWREAAGSFERLAAFSGAFFTLGADGRAAERVQGAYVKHELFAVLGLRPERGRDFVADDDLPGAASVALVGRGTAETLLGGVDRAVGQTVLLDGTPTTVIGVMPSGVSFPLNGELWRPLAHLPGLRQSPRDRRVLGTIGRLATGVTTAAALAELTALAERTTNAAADAGRRVRPTITTFRERFLGRATDAVPLALLVVASMVLLVGCATAATLLFARSAYRMDEATMRVALGASRRRLIGQLLVECGVYAGVAGLAGLAMAHLFLRWFGGEIVGAGLPPWVRFVVDARVTTIALSATLVATFLGGLAPAWRLAGSALSTVPGRTRATDGRSTQRWIQGLLVAKVALTVVLLSTSGYLLTSALALWRLDQVIDTRGVITARLGLSGPGLANVDQRAAFTRQFAERLHGRRDLAAATITSGPPFAGVVPRRVAVDGLAIAPLDAPTARVSAIDPSYFATLGLRLVAGRAFSDRDDATSPVAVVNAAFAARHLGQDAIGRRIRLAPSMTEDPAGPWLTVVGVAPSLRHSPRPDADPAIYIPLALEHPSTVFVMVRAAEGVAVAEILRDELHALNPALALYGWQTLARMSEISRWTMRTVGTIVIVLGILALALATLGIYAVTAYAAGRRVKEAGIRVALGATVPAVMRLFMRGTLWPIGGGLGIGLVGGWAAALALRALVLDGVDIGTNMLGPATVVIGIVAVVASLLPARRVAGADPLPALRCD